MPAPAPKRSPIPSLARGLLGLTVVLCALFLLRPLFPQLKLGPTVLASFVLLTATALITTLVIAPLPRTPWPARAAQHSLVALLLCSGASLAPPETPLWMPLGVLVIFVSGVESMRWAALLGLVCGLLLGGATGARSLYAFGASMIGLAGIGLAGSLTLARLRNRAAELGRVITRMRQGVDFIEADGDEEVKAGTVRRETPALRKVSEAARTVRDLDRSAHLTKTLAPFLELARGMNHAHAALFFDIDRKRNGAFLRASDGPEEIQADAVMPIDADPLGFVLDRGRSFYATDFRSLLWSLPYYNKAKHIGTLLAVPVEVRGVISGVLVVDHEETQALAEAEPLLRRLALLIAQVVENERETLAHAEREVEFEAAAFASQNLAMITEVPEIHAFAARAVKEMAPRTIGVGLVRLRGDSIVGLPGMSEQFEAWMGEGARITDRTWIAWYLSGAAEPMRIDTPKDRGLPLFRPAGGMPGESLLVHPLRFRNRLQGALVAVGDREAFDASVGRVIALIANQAAAAIDLIELVETNRNLALHDGLTGLLNRRAFDEALARAVAQSVRSRQPVALLMIDLDHFKQLNDAYGHAVGDIALQGAANEIRQQARGGDMAARYGGEEFAIILPDTDGPAAFRMAERVRKALAEGVMHVGQEQVRISASCGVSATDLGYDTPDALVRSADEALYASKATGRNRTSLAGAPRG